MAAVMSVRTLRAARRKRKGKGDRVAKRERASEAGASGAGGRGWKGVCLPVTEAEGQEKRGAAAAAARITQLFNLKPPDSN